MRIWRLTLLPLLLVACTEQPIAAPEFNANGVVDDDMSEYTLLGEFPADLPIEYGLELPCLGEGLFGYDGGLYQWWRKTIRMPSGGHVGVEKVLQPEYGSYYNELGDRWQTTRIQARISRITRPGDGHTLIREAFNEWVENEDTGQQARITFVLQKERDEAGGTVTAIEKIAHCSLTGKKN
jgi:hypothetical protein